MSSSVSPAGLSCTLAALLAALACAPASVGEPAPEASASAKPAEVEPEENPEATAQAEPEEKLASTAEAEPTPKPAIEIRDSDLHDGFIVDPAVQPGLARFAEELEATLADTVKPGTRGASAWVGRLEGNGGRDVLIYIPPGADNAKPFELVFSTEASSV